MMIQPLNSFQRKSRQRARARLFGNTLIIGSILAVFFFAYRFGEEQMAARIGQRMDEVQSLTAERDSLHKQVIDLQAAALVDRQKIADLDARFRDFIPDAQMEGFVTLLRNKLAAGVSPDRMHSLLSAAANPRSCRGRESKRFMISTSLNQGTDSSASFGGGAVILSGDGQSAVSADGKPEAWFDLSRKVSMKFKLIGGRVTVAEGTLPLVHSIIDDSTEYRFTIEPGPRGFVNVTGDQCDYPYTPVAPTPAPAASTVE